MEVNSSRDIKKRLVSLIIPTYSRPDNLVRAIKSILNQTYSPIEIIVVDDNGIDTENQQETERLLSPYIERHGIVYIKHPFNKNGSAARNTGFVASKGEYINFIDDDDELLPNKVGLQVSYLNENPGYAGVCCKTICVIKGKETTMPMKFTGEGNFMAAMLANKITFNTTTIMFRRSCIQELNGWDESFLRHQDYELLMRFARKYQMGCVNQALIKKYATENIISRNPLKSIDYLNYFLETFKNDIEEWPTHRIVYKERYLEIAQNLLALGYKRDGLKFFAKSFGYGIPNLKRIGYLGYFLLRPRKRCK